MAENRAHLARAEIEDAPPVGVPHEAALSVLGNDDQLLSLLRQKAGAAAVRDLVALTLATSRGLGIKVINAGGAAAFKE